MELLHPLLYFYEIPDDNYPERVDVQRLWRKAQELPLVYFNPYMEKLYKWAPRIYARVREYERQSGGNSLYVWREEKGRQAA